MIGGVRVSWAVLILHPSRKVTIYSHGEKVLRSKLVGNGLTEFRVWVLVRIDAIQMRVKSSGNKG
jgi:hypothetical protein